MSRASVSNWLHEEGWAVPNVAKAGRILAIDRVNRCRMPRWAEIAAKDKPIEFRAQKEFRHGIDLPYWQECRQVEQATGIPGYLFIIQNRPFEGATPSPLLLVQALSLLKNVPVQEVPPSAQKWAPHGLIMWRQADFTMLGEPDSAATRMSLRAWMAEGTGARLAGKQWELQL